MKSFKYSLFLILLHSITESYSQKSISTIIRGNLSANWQLSFTIFAKELKGVILYCIDNRGTQMGLFVTRDDSNHYRITATFNLMNRELPLEHLCGCDSCQGTRLKFHIQSVNDYINVMCNDKGSQLISISRKYDLIYKKSKNIIYPVPMAIMNMTNAMFIMVGNIGPYSGSDMSPVFPVKEESVGCLDEFFFDNKRIQFKSNGTKMRPSCPIKCNDIICNGGICTEIFDGINCDCTAAVRNGPYCNNSLVLYKRGAVNTYENMKHTANISFKMSWRLLFDRHFCLLEIVNEKGSSVISVEVNKLMLNSNVINNNINGINFVNVNLSNNYLIIKTKNDSTKIKFSFDERIRINVGFTENNVGCEIFDGAYDFHFTSTLRQVTTRQVIPRQATSRQPSSHSTYSSTSKLPTKSQPIQNMSLIVSVVVVFIFMMFGSILFYKLYRKMSFQLQSLVANPSGSKDFALTNERVYGQVVDTDDYESVSDNDIYQSAEVI